MVTFAQAIREGKMDIHTKDFTILTGDTPISVRYMFDHQEEFKLVKDILKINKISNKSESMKDSLLLCSKINFYI